jgi:TP901 family phage tail tape measure protein
MARTIVDEQLRYEIIINGDSAKNELNKLDQNTRKLRETNKNLTAEKAKLRAEGKQETAYYKSLTATIRENNQTIKTNELRMSELRNEIGLTGLSLAQLQAKATQARAIIRHLIPGTADYKKYRAELDAINSRIRQLNTNANATAFSFSRLADQFNKYQTIGFAIIGTITGIALSIKSLIGYNKELADAQANVRKTTGFTDEQTQELMRTFSSFDTRTPRMQLLALAEEAGRLGKKTMEEVVGFTRVADKLFVALGDDFGANAEDQIRNIGKMVDVYSVAQKEALDFEGSMNALGSAINEVAASGSTKADYLVEFMKRTGGMSRQAKIAAQEIIGYAATLDEAGLSSEVSSTVMSNLLTKMFKKTEEFAAAANIPLAEFRDLLEKDANEALLRFFEGVNRNQGGLSELVENMDGLGVDGQRATGVLATLAASTDKVREKQALANQAMKEGTSLTNEFNIKNENLAGVVDKITRRFKAFFSFEGIREGMFNMAKWIGNFVGAIHDADSSAHRWRDVLGFLAKTIAVVVTSLVSYKLALMALNAVKKEGIVVTLWSTAVEKAKAAQTIISDAITHAYAAAYSLLTGNIKAATFATRAFFTVLKANPIGLVIGAITAVTSAYFLFRKEQDAVNTSYDRMAKASREASKATQDEHAALQARLTVLSSIHISDEQRAKALKELQKEYPDYLDKIQTEKVSLGQLEIIQQSVNDRIRDKIALLREEALASAFSKEMEDFARRRLETENKLYDQQLKLVALEQEKAKLYQGDNLGGFDYADLQRSEQIAGIEAQIEATKELIAAEQKLINKQEGQFINRFETIATKMAVTMSQDSPTEPVDDGGGGLSDELAKRLEDVRQKITDMRRELELGAMEEMEREIQRTRDKYAKLIVEAQGFAKEIKELEALREEEILTIRGTWAKKIIDEVEQYQRESQAKEKEAQEKLEKEKQDIRRKYNFVSKEEEYNEELALLKTYLDKQLLTQEEYERALLELEKKYNEEKSKFKYTRRDERLRELEEYARGFAVANQAIGNLMQMELLRNEAIQQAGESEEAFTKRKAQEEDKRKEIEKKYAGLRMLTTISEIVAQTALAIMKVAPIVPLQILQGIAGATQLGVAQAEYQRIQGFEMGRYPVMDQLGRRFNAPKVSNPGTGKLSQPTILAGEKPEIIIDPATTRFLELNYPDIIRTIYASAARIKGFEAGRYPGRGTALVNSAAGGNLDLILKEMTTIMVALTERLSTPMRAVYDDHEVRRIRERDEINQQVSNARKP